MPKTFQKGDTIKNGDTFSITWNQSDSGIKDVEMTVHQAAVKSEAPVFQVIVSPDATVNVAP